MMTYSVITICLNSASSIRRTIRSVLTQTVLPAEYLFVDGGSTDGTLEAIREETGAPDGRGSGIRFHLLHQATKEGIPEAWNMGLKVAASDLVFLLNSDDWYDEDSAEKILSIFVDHPDTEILAGAARYVHETGTGKTIRFVKSFAFFPVLMPIRHPACFVRKDVYEKIGLFNEKYKVSADYDFVYRAYSAGVRIRTVDRILANSQMGGFAGRNRVIARGETLEIGMQHCRLKILPWIAYFVRILTNR